MRVDAFHDIDIWHTGACVWYDLCMALHVSVAAATNLPYRHGSAQGSCPGHAAEVRVLRVLGKVHLLHAVCTRGQERIEHWNSSICILDVVHCRAKVASTAVCTCSNGVFSTLARRIVLLRCLCPLGLREEVTCLELGPMHCVLAVRCRSTWTTCKAYICLCRHFLAPSSFTCISVCVCIVQRTGLVSCRNRTSQP